MSTATITPRMQFRDVLTQVVEQAKALLPEQVNGRIEAGATLVLQGDVFFQDDGSVEVGSSDPAKVYRLSGTTCTCKDFTDGRAPQSWCKHRIAANLQRSVERVLARRTPDQDDNYNVETPVPMAPDWVEPFPDNCPELEPDQDYPGNVEPPAVPSLPEAPASVNVRITIGGREVQWTLRDTDEDRLAVRLENLLARYPQPQPPAPPSTQSREGYCQPHGVQMQWNNGKNGRKGWFSHKTANGWCNGRPPLD